MRRLLRFLLFVVIPLLLVGLFLTSMSSYWMFHRFNSEQAIAELTFKPFARDVYIAELRTGDFCLAEEFPVYGDQWQLDAQFLKWKDPGVLIGLQSLYQLDRLSGRYADTNQQNTEHKQSHDLQAEVWFDLFESGLLKKDHWLVDTTYGSSVYMDIDITKTYVVLKTEDALIVKQKPRNFDRENNSIITIQINRACAKEPHWTEYFANQLNNLALQHLQIGL